MGKNYWMMVASPEDFEITKEHGFTVYGVRGKYRLTGLVRRVDIEHCVRIDEVELLDCTFDRYDSIGVVVDREAMMCGRQRCECRECQADDGKGGSAHRLNVPGECAGIFHDPAGGGYRGMPRELDRLFFRKAYRSKGSPCTDSFKSSSLASLPRSFSIYG